MANEQIMTRCCVVGGGPCGLMLGYLLARAGVDVVVLEKHADFLRDFRGATIHPSTLDIMCELGLLDDFLKLPHHKEATLSAYFGGQQYAFADFRQLSTRCKFIALMPQWDFLNFLADRGKRYPSFHLRTRTEAVELIESNGRVTGVRATTPDGSLEIRADLVVGCDGRQSMVRDRAGLRVDDIGAPMDVLWFRLPKRPQDPGESMGRFQSGGIVVLIDRGDYWQCAFLIPKGSIEETKRAGLPAFRQTVAQVMPVFADRVDDLKDWDQIKLLNRGGRPARALASPGAAVHRRCRARDVAHRRRRRQSGGAGRSGGGEYPVAAAQGRNCDGGRPRPRAEAARISHPRHPAAPGLHSE